VCVALWCHPLPSLCTARASPEEHAFDPTLFDRWARAGEVKYDRERFAALGGAREAVIACGVCGAVAPQLSANAAVANLDPADASDPDKYPSRAGLRLAVRCCAGRAEDGPRDGKQHAEQHESVGAAILRVPCVGDAAGVRDVCALAARLRAAGAENALDALFGNFKSRTQPVLQSSLRQTYYGFLTCRMAIFQLDSQRVFFFQIFVLISIHARPFFLLSPHVAQYHLPLCLSVVRRRASRVLVTGRLRPRRPVRE
jgi:hypothetical protein